jgi:uncharacterized membrane protein YkoI
MNRRLAGACLAVLIPASLAAAENGARDADDHAAAGPTADARGGDHDADDVDQNQARELREHGVIHPLRDVLERVRTASPGEVVGIALARRGGRWVYGIKVLTPAGRRVEVGVDAGTLAIVPARR